MVRGLTRRWRLHADSNSNGGLMQRVLAARGIVQSDDIRRFCEPKLTDLHDPALMPNIDAAVTRLIDGLRRDDVIAIYGDYDVDGICATSILYHVIKAVQPGARLRTYVPHRADEGYGLNCEALRQLRSEGVSLVITVDCGITAVRSAQTAREIGLELIITDHHELGDVAQLPNAVALVHPRLPGSAYPFGELCGAGVAFKLAWRFATAWCNSQRVSQALQKTLIDMLPLVAMATVADVVPLVGENRVLTSFGLRWIKQSPLVGLGALIDASNLQDDHIDSEKVGFILGPRLNACGRMGHAAEAIRMLTEASAEEALAIARSLTELNKRRQSVERHIFESASQMAEDAGMTSPDCRIIILAHESWHPGVVGIACSRLVERFCRPAVLLNRGREVCKGSARSIDGYSIHEGLSAGAAYMQSFGGHAAAAGLSIVPEQLERFVQAVSAHANAHIADDQLMPSVAIDCDAALHELNLETVRTLQALSPFGRENRPPALRIANVTLAAPPRQIGANGKHLSLQVRQELDGRRHFMRAVWWNAGERAADLAPGMRLDLAIEPRLNEYNGQISVEASLHDVKVGEPAAMASQHSA